MINIKKFNYEKCCIELKKKFKEDFVMLVRFHPNTKIDSDFIKFNKMVINATKYSDVQELIATSMVIITDYSSIAFEAGLVYKPVFLYTKDLDEYIKN